MPSSDDKLQTIIRATVDAHFDGDAIDMNKAVRALHKAVKAAPCAVLWAFVEPHWATLAMDALRREVASRRQQRRNRPEPQPKPKFKYDETKDKPEVITTIVSRHRRRVGPKVLVALSIFDSKTELGRPLGDMSKEELIALRDRSASRKKFYDHLQQPLPPRGIVRDHWKAAEVEAWIKKQTPNLLLAAAE